MKKPGLEATTQEREKFEHFLFEMDDVLDAFIVEARSRGFSLNYSLESLESLETLLLKQYGPGENGVVLKSRAARYLGEVFRKAFGWRWELCLKGPAYLYFKLPVISGYSASGIEFCPIEVLASFLHSRRKGMLRQAVESHRL
jgi:hypothetical protein